MNCETDFDLEIEEYTEGEKLALRPGKNSSRLWDHLHLHLLALTIFPGLVVSTLAGLGLFSWSGWMLGFYVFIPLGLHFFSAKWRRLTIDSSGIRIEMGLGTFSRFVSTVDHSLAECTKLRGVASVGMDSGIELTFFKGEDSMVRIRFPFQGVLSSPDLFEFLSRIAKILDLTHWRPISGSGLMIEFGRDPESSYRMEDAKLPVDERIDEFPGEMPDLIPAGFEVKASVLRPGRLILRHPTVSGFGSVSVCLIWFGLLPAILAAPFGIHVGLLLGGKVSPGSLVSILMLLQGFLCLISASQIVLSSWFRGSVLDLHSDRGTATFARKRLLFQEVNGVILRSPESRYRHGVGGAGGTSTIWIRTGQNVFCLLAHRGKASLETMRPLAGEIARRIGCPLYVKRAGEIGIGMDAFQAAEDDPAPVDLLSLADEKESADPGREEAEKSFPCPHCRVIYEHRYSEGRRGGSSYWICDFCGCSFDEPASSPTASPR